MQSAPSEVLDNRVLCFACAVWIRTGANQVSTCESVWLGADARARSENTGLKEL